MQGGNNGELFEWLKETVIDNLYYTQSYNGIDLDDYNQKFTHTGIAMRMGPPRIRQLRVKPGFFLLTNYIFEENV